MRCALAVALIGLAGCPNVDLGDIPSDIGSCNPSGGLAYFTSQIEPSYLLLGDPATSCARSGCHDNEHGFALQTMPVDDEVNYRLAQAALDCGEPMASEMLARPMGDDHAVIIEPGDPRIALFLAWFQP